MTTNNIESSVLKLETLQKQFSLAMKEYKETLATYKNVVNDVKSKKTFTTIPGYIYVGGFGGGNQNAPLLRMEAVPAGDQKKCEALCSSDSRCKGATFFEFFSSANFINTSSICATYGGINEPSPYSSSRSKTTTLIPNSSMSQFYLEKINTLNALLLRLHDEILNTLKKVNPEYQNVVKNTEIEGKNLEDIYMSLNDEKKKIDKLLGKYNTLERRQTDSGLRTESNYMYYRVLMIVAVIVVFVTLKQLLFTSFSSYGMMGGGKSSFYDLCYNFILMILLLLLAQTFNHSAGYILWALLVLTYVLIKLKVFSKFK